MRRDELPELQYITLMVNLPSIGQHGILAHKLAEKVDHESVAAQEIQDRRKDKRVPGGRLLHEYANLYILARNPMMTRRRDRMAELCVLRVSTDVLDLPGVVITDGNAASDYTRFAASPAGLAIVDREATFAEYWTDSDQIRYFEKKRAKCAEVLVPDRVPQRFIDGAWVRDAAALAVFEALGLGLEGRVDGHLFSC